MDDDNNDNALKSAYSFDELRMSQRSTTQSEPARSRVYSEEDEEIRIAKAMALAIQNNPNMTTDEIHQLTSDLQKQSEMVAKQNIAVATAPAPASVFSFKDVDDDDDLLIPGRLTEVMSERERPPSTAAALADAALPSPPDKPGAEFEKQKKRMAMTAKQLRDKAKGKFKDIVGGNPKTGASSTDDSNRTSDSSSSSPPTREKPKLPKISPKPPPCPKTPPRAPFGNRSVSNPQPPPALDVPPLQDEASASIAFMAPPTKKQTSPSSESQAASADNVRLSAVLWKRRSGFGKLSSKHAWEQRRVILAGTTLSYFKKVENGVEESDVQESTPSAAFDDSLNASESLVSSSKAPTPTEAGGSAGRKPSTWFEQAAMNIEKAKANLTEIGIISNSEIDRNPPRGSLDLVKERAIVAATTGHSGAPSPFCISIKVRDETKWKFCFESHTQQMEWLAALTDVVVACSVDDYNAALVCAADPNNENAGLFVAAPLEPEHDSTEGHRLWMIQKYNIRSGTGFSESSEEASSSSDEDGLELEGGDGVRSLAPMNGESSSRELAVGAAESLMLRDKNLQIMTILMNAALFYSHASSTGISKFWYLVTCVNLALWSLLVKDSEDKKIEGIISPSPGGAVRSRSRVKPIAGDEKGKGKKGAQNNKVPSDKPVAGTTTMQIENPKDVPSNKDGQIFAGWRALPGTNMMVRSHGYLSTKEKVPSPGELYKLANVDIFESPRQYREMAPRVKLPGLDFDDGGVKKTWHAPDVFVISVALPTDPPKMRGSSDDGGGYTITMYYTMRKDTRDILQRVTAPDYDPTTEKVDDPQKSKVNAAKLLNSWCRRAPTDPKFQARFKLVATAQNLKEIGMPNWIAKYNGKPVLIKRAGTTGFLYSHPELNAMEFDVTFHPFPYLAKQAICYMKENFFKKVLVTFGFCIEGRSDDELPECLIGLMQLCYPDPQYAIQADDFFSGKSQKSF